jgi:hypothetical protein
MNNLISPDMVDSCEVYMREWSESAVMSGFDFI